MGYNLGLFTLVVVCGVCELKIVSPPSDVNSLDGQIAYLTRFGYLDSRDRKLIKDSGNVIKEALLKFQNMANIPLTGVIDKDTLKMMNTPRCGNVDYGEDTSLLEARRRTRRYVLHGSKWYQKNLRYKITNPTPDFNLTDVKSEIRRAWQVWSDVSQLDFKEVENTWSHIEVKWATGYHGDNHTFDGPKKILAHAYFPLFGGDVHFDEDEDWTMGMIYGTNLFQVAAHEFGHSLGLSHTNNSESLMYSFHRGYQPDFRLHQDDIEGIQHLYGKQKPTETHGKPNPSVPVNPGTTTEQPEPQEEDLRPAYFCQDSNVDAMTTFSDGFTYAFKGAFYYKLDSDGVVEIGHISGDLGGVPSNLDAAMYVHGVYNNIIFKCQRQGKPATCQYREWSRVNRMYLFKGSRCWYIKGKLLYGPASISDLFPGIPDNLDAAFVWARDHKLYFVKDGQYWRYSSLYQVDVDTGYPKPFSEWGITTVEAAFQATNGRTYFFAGNQYYRYNDNTGSIDTASVPYPRSIAVWWFGCNADYGNIRSGINDFTNSGRNYNYTGLSVYGTRPVEFKPKVIPDPPAEIIKDIIQDYNHSTCKHNFAFELYVVITTLVIYMSI